MSFTDVILALAPVIAARVGANQKSKREAEPAMQAQANPQGYLLGGLLQQQALSQQPAMQAQGYLLGGLLQAGHWPDCSPGRSRFFQGQGCR